VSVCTVPKFMVVSVSNKLTACCRVLEKPVVGQLAKFPAFYRTIRPVTISMIHENLPLHPFLSQMNQVHILKISQVGSSSASLCLIVNFHFCQTESHHLRFLQNPPGKRSFAEIVERFNANIPYSGLLHSVTQDVSTVLIVASLVHTRPLTHWP
jgi:hypothetical protein